MSTSESENSSSGLRKTGSSLGSSTFWLMTIIINLVYLFYVNSVFFEPDEGDSTPSYIVYGFLVLFGLVAVGFLFKGILNLLRHWKYGSTTLRLETNPGVLGGPLKGELLVPERLHRDANEMHFHLTCVKITEKDYGNGDSSRTRTPIWNGVKTVPATEWTRASNPSEKTIPFTMTIPYGCQETDRSGSNEITWELTAHADVSGLDFSVTFTVPVKETERSEPELTEEEIIDLKSVDRPEGLEDVSFRETGNGFVFGRSMFYAPLFYLTWILVGGMFAGVGYVGFRFAEEIPYLPILVYGPAALFVLVGLIIAGYSVQSLIQSHHVTVRPDELRLQTSWFGYQQEYIIPSQNMEDIKLEHSGNWRGNPIHHLTFSRSDGTDVKTAHFCADKRVMEYLVQEIQDTMGI